MGSSFVQRFVARCRAITGRPAPAWRHRRGHVRHRTAAPPAAPAPPVVVPAAPEPHPATPTVLHLGVVGLKGTIGYAAGEASARALAERRFNGPDPRAGTGRTASRSVVIDPRHPSVRPPQEPSS